MSMDLQVGDRVMDMNHLRHGAMTVTAVDAEGAAAEDRHGREHRLTETGGLRRIQSLSMTEAAEVLA